MFFSKPRISKYHNSFLLVLLLALCATVFSDRGWTRTQATKDPEVDRAIERAAALYKQFKARDALAELQRALKMDPHNLEALVWSARAYIDLGDLIPQTGPNWQDKRKEQYRTAETHAKANAYCGHHLR